MDHGNYVIVGKVADRFSAVAGALIDLKVAAQMIERCVDERCDDTDDDVADFYEAFWTTALIRFRRAFTKGRGVDWGHGDLVDSLSPEHRRSFDRFYMLADKFIAHPVGIGEDLAVTAVLGPAAGGSVNVYGGTVRKTRVTSPGTDLAKELRTLLAALIPLVAELEEVVHKEFLLEIRTWSPAELLKGGKYEEAIHFDETSDRYRRALKPYRRGGSAA